VRSPGGPSAGTAGGTATPHRDDAGADLGAVIPRWEADLSKRELAAYVDAVLVDETEPTALAEVLADHDARRALVRRFDALAEERVLLDSLQSDAGQLVASVAIGVALRELAAEVRDPWTGYLA
jgi:hypothetical protein